MVQTHIKQKYRTIELYRTSNLYEPNAVLKNKIIVRLYRNLNEE